MLLWTLIYKFWCRPMFSVLFSIYLRVELLSHIVTLCLTVFPWLHHFAFLPAVYKGSSFSTSCLFGSSHSSGYEVVAPSIGLLFSLFFFFLSFVLFRATPVAYGGSQARGLIRAVAAGLHKRHSNIIRAPSATYTTAHSNAGSLTHWARQGIEPSTLWFLVRFVSAVPRWKLLTVFLICISLMNDVKILSCAYWLFVYLFISLKKSGCGSFYYWVVRVLYIF